MLVYCKDSDAENTSPYDSVRIINNGAVTGTMVLHNSSHSNSDTGTFVQREYNFFEGKFTFLGLKLHQNERV